ncbi:MAG: gamma-glutamyltransferase [Methanosarcinales archaeon]|nr:gamma-glutamyltransferase [Methanosarcinales archaeon]
MDFKEIESKFQPTEDGKCAEAENGMVATAFPDATYAGVAMLKRGGNAVDAACAAALALGVCEPQSSGIGGQTMMLISLGEKVLAIDGSSRAPSLAHVSGIYKGDRSYGYRATTVPSTPATLGYVNNHYGRLSWEKIMEPAIRLAEYGYVITPLQHRLQKQELKNFDKVESRSGKRYFLKAGEPYTPGERFYQPDLAKMLRILARKGVEEFYQGTIAKQIDADMRENGGLLRYDDLALIPWPILRKPLKRKFRGLFVYSMPPPGAGRSLLFTLMMINMIKPRHLNRDEFDRALLLVEIFRNSILERSDRPFDPNYYPQVAGENMLKRTYVRKCIHKITRETQIHMPIHETEDELAGETTHLSVIDNSGMAVSLTQSIEKVYGSKSAAAGLGFLYNNYLSDYEYKIFSHPFYLRPNAVPWATVAPTLIFRNKEIWLAVGSPGSERIFSSIAQFLIHVVDEHQPIDEAMQAPRLHCSLGGRVSLEAERFPDELVTLFQEKGYRIDKREPFSFYLGAIHAVLKKHDGTGFQGVAEVRRDGTAGGY